MEVHVMNGKDGGAKLRVGLNRQRMMLREI